MAQGSVLIEAVSSPWAPVALLAALVLYYLVPYFSSYSSLRGIPAPFPAQFTNIWLMLTARRGIRSELVHEAHQKLGPVVRIAPNHVSIVDTDAIQSIYGHGNGFLKADFYDTFVSIRRGLFNTRDRKEHSRKRKIVSHTFSPKSVLDFEPYITQNLELFASQWDKMINTPENRGAARLDCLAWFNYLAFDIIADLAFGKPFGMLASGADMAEVRSSPTSPPIYAPACEILNRRGEVSATLGCMPWLKPYAGYFPDSFFTKGLAAVQNLAGIAIARVSERLESPPSITRKDLLARLQEGRDEKGEPLGREELTAEALTQLIAGSDTTSNTSCALLYHVVRTPGVMKKLQEELDAAIPPGATIPTYEQVKHLPYLGMVINEALRHHAPSGIGLPRQIPPNSRGIDILGYHFEAGTVLSVPTYTIHHDEKIWGKDAWEFRPERWETLTDKQKNSFIPFSHGPRACVGRNLAEMQLRMIIGTWARRYNVELKQEIMETREGFLRKPMGLEVEITRR